MNFDRMLYSSWQYEQDNPGPWDEESEMYYSENWDSENEFFDGFIVFDADR
jgi:hypothetical protein